MNRGLILEPIDPMSLLRGSALPSRNPSGDWEPYLPEFERQAKFGLETMNCVQFSFLNVLETIARSHNKTLNLSDRFLSWAAKCTPNGNTYSKCIKGFVENGCCNEDLWKWIEAMSWETYNQEPPQDVKWEAQKIFNEWDFNGVTYVPSALADLKEALTRSPLWFCNSQHSMEMFRADDRIRAFDTYGTDGKGSFGLDYVQHIEAAYNVSFTPKNSSPMPPQFPFAENCMYQLVEGVGGFLLYAKGRMYRDTEAKILATWTVRSGSNGVFERGKVGTLRLKDIEGTQLYNLKDEPTSL